jgi:hypothetical protein
MEHMFNADQQTYIHYIASIPPEQRCWCGWALLGECINSDCPKDKTHVDWLKVYRPDAGDAMSTRAGSGEDVT